MNPNLTTVAFTIAALGLVAGFDLIPGAGLTAGMIMLAIGGVLLTGQLLDTSKLWLSSRKR